VPKKNIEVDYIPGDVVDILDVDLVKVYAMGAITHVWVGLDGAVNYGIDSEMNSNKSWRLPAPRLRPHVPDETVSEPIEN